MIFLRAGKTWLGGRLVARVSMIRRAVYMISLSTCVYFEILTLTLEGTSSSASSGSGPVPIGMRPFKIAPARFWL
jgi:hypothetical protein